MRQGHDFPPVNGPRLGMTRHDYRTAGWKSWQLIDFLVQSGACSKLTAIHRAERLGAVVLRQLPRGFLSTDRDQRFRDESEFSAGQGSFAMSTLDAR